MTKITSLKITYSPWAFFILFLSADFLLVFAQVSLMVYLAIILFGILIPFIMALFLLKEPAPASEKSSFFHTEWFEIGPAHWILLAGLFAVASLYKLTSLPWPVPDDGYFAYWAKRVAEKGDWRILYGTSHVEPLFIWGLAGWFKLFQSSLLALKTFPILIYVGVLTAGYWAARQYFSKTISFMALWFLAFNFWTILIVRQCEDALSLLLFECLAFYFLGVFLSDSEEKKPQSLWWLAFCVGVGFYTYTAWPVVAVMAVLPVLVRARRHFSQSAKKTIGFLLVCFLLAWPLIHAHFLPGGDGVFHRVLSGRWMGLNLDYAVMFLRNGLGIVPEDPSRLGWLNPCWGALFLIGFLELWRWRLTPIAQWGLLAFFLFLLPGVLTATIEMYHVLAVLPLICVLTALGIRSLFSNARLSKGQRNLLFLFLGLFSLGLDLYHYAGPGQLHDFNYWAANKRHLTAIDFSRAYPLLEEARQDGTPLSLAIHFNNNIQDQTLSVVISPFDEYGHVGLLNRPAPRMAILVNCNYEAYLKKEFFHSNWTWISPDLANDNGGLMLGFVPINAATEKTIRRWKEADEVFKRNNAVYMDPVSDQMAEALKDLYTHYSVFQGDRFLESVFWERVAFYEECQNKIPEAVGALRKGAQDGYPAAQFYNQLGELFAFFGKKTEAEGYFKKAIECPVNRTNAEENLKNLKSI